MIHLFCPNFCFHVLCQIIMLMGTPKLLVRLLRYPNWGGQQHLLLRWVQQLVQQVQQLGTQANGGHMGNHNAQVRDLLQHQQISFFFLGQVQQKHPKNRMKNVFRWEKKVIKSSLFKNILSKLKVLLE